MRRAQIMTYCDKHWPCPIMQIVRATGVERSRCKRILRQAGLITQANVMPVDFSPMAEIRQVA